MEIVRNAIDYCKVELSLKWDKNCILGEVFKRPTYWNQYKAIPYKTYNANGYTRELLDSSYQGVKRLFVLAYDNTNGITPNSHKRFFLPRIVIKNYIEIDERKFYDQPINDLIKQYDEIRKISTGQGDDYQICN